MPGRRWIQGQFACRLVMLLLRVWSSSAGGVAASRSCRSLASGSFGRDLLLVEATVSEAERKVAALCHFLVVSDDEDGGVVRVGERA